jgi:hypothetical protein
MQHVANHLTSLSMALSCTTGEAQWQTDANMLAALAQLSELRRLDVGNCLFIPTDGEHLTLQPFQLAVHVIRHDLDSPLAYSATILSRDMSTCVGCVQGPLPAHSCQR